MSAPRPAPAGPSIVVPRSVSWTDTDASGHHHFSAVLRWVEETETLLLEQLGIADELAGACPRVRIEVDYMRPLRFREMVDVHLRVEKLGRRSLQYSFSVTSAREVAAEGCYIVVCRPADTMVSAPWPDNIRTQLSGGRASEMAGAE